MNELAASSLSLGRGVILRYEALQEITHHVLIDTPAVKVEVRNLDFKDPVIKGLINRIKMARIPWDKKEKLLKLVFMYLRSGEGSSSGAKDQNDFIEEMNSLIQTMELTEKARISDEELMDQRKKADQMCTDFLVEEERSKQLKEKQQKVFYNTGAASSSELQGDAEPAGSLNKVYSVL